MANEVEAAPRKRGLSAWCHEWYPVFGVVAYTISGVSAVGAVITALVTVIVNYPSKTPNTAIDNFVDSVSDLLSERTYNFLLTYRWEILIGCGALVFLRSVLAYFTQRRKLRAMSMVDDVAREYCTFLTKLQAYTLSFKQHGKMPSAQAKSLFREATSDMDDFFVSTANKISLLFSQYTRSKCHVSIKLFVPTTKQIRTVARDQISLTNRKMIDEDMNWYPYERNSAFKQILDNGKTEAYLSNHLVLRWLFRRYKNAHPRWYRYYTACLVVPITMSTHSSRINHDTVLGFLCVDNKGGGFDSRAAMKVLQSFARMYQFVSKASEDLPGRDLV